MGFFSFGDPYSRSNQRHRDRFDTNTFGLTEKHKAAPVLDPEYREIGRYAMVRLKDEQPDYFWEVMKIGGREKMHPGLLGKWHEADITLLLDRLASGASLHTALEEHQDKMVNERGYKTQHNQTARRKDRYERKVKTEKRNKAAKAQADRHKHDDTLSTEAALLDDRARKETTKGHKK